LNFILETFIFCAVVVLAGLAGWIFLGRFAVRFFDRFFLVVTSQLPVTPMEIREREFAIGAQIWPFPRNEVIPFEIEKDGQNRLVLKIDGRSFSLGPVVKEWAAGKNETASPVGFEPDAGDQVSMTQSYSRLAWPTPFEINILGGSVSRWRRHLYDRLVWRKSFGQVLEIVWRHQQWLMNKGSEWHDQYDLRLVSIRVSRDPVQEIVARYLQKAKGWDERSYRLEHRAPEDGCEVVAVIHRSDETGESPGAGKSVVLMIDPASRKIVREIGGQ
jgi:hypothetical protein